jgi:hypothetical protein
MTFLSISHNRFDENVKIYFRFRKNKDLTIDTDMPELLDDHHAPIILGPKDLTKDEGRDGQLR